MVKTINISKDIDYRTQRNNIYYPLSSCNTTSYAMALDIMNLSKYLTVPKGQQLEDFLTLYFREPWAYEMMAKLAPWATTDYSPQEIHAVLEAGINKLFMPFFDKPVVKFKTMCTKEDFLDELKAGRPVILSGKFAGLGHIVCLVGAEYDDETNVINKWIIDDPYGDFHVSYAIGSKGNNVIMTQDEFNNCLKENGKPNTKWGHIFLIDPIPFREEEIS